MPFVRNIYTAHPVTGVAGLWIETTSGLGLVGRARTAWPAVPGGDPTTRRARFEAALNTALQALFEERIPTSAFDPADPKLTTPEPFCRIEGPDYVMRHTTIFVPVVSISPSIVLGPIKLTAAAARLVSA